MSQYQSFFVNAFGGGGQCDELNQFLRSHVVIRTVENIISGGNNCGVQILVEYKDIAGQTDKQQKIRVDYRAELKTEEQRAVFDKLKELRLTIAKRKNLKAAYLVCKDEHLFAIVNNQKITEEEIASLPNGKNILLKDFAHELCTGYQKILEEQKNIQTEENVINTDIKNQQNTNETSEIPF